MFKYKRNVSVTILDYLGKCCVKLQHLKISSCASDDTEQLSLLQDENAMIKLLENNKSLINITLRGISVSDKVSKIIVDNNQKLKTFHVKECLEEGNSFSLDNCVDMIKSLLSLMPP